MQQDTRTSAESTLMAAAEPGMAGSRGVSLRGAAARGETGHTDLEAKTKMGP